MEYLTGQDLQQGETREIDVNSRILRRIIQTYGSGFGSNKSLEGLLKTSSQFTSSTCREIAFDLYSAFPKFPHYSKRPDHLECFKRIAVPEIGDMTSVKNPYKDPKLYPEFAEKERVLYFPVFGVHSHPYGGFAAVASKNDLMRSVERFSTLVDINGNRLKVQNQIIEVIDSNHYGDQHSVSEQVFADEYLFFQFNGDRDAYQKYILDYQRRLEYGFKKDSYEFATNFEAELKSSGAFNVLAFKGHDLFEFNAYNPEQFSETKHPDFDIRITERALRKICKTFPYKIKVEKVY